MDVEYQWEITLQRIQQRIPDAVEILARSIFLHIGWEMDNEICAVRMKDGSRIIVGTSHGGIYEYEEGTVLKHIALCDLALTQSKAVLAAVQPKEETPDACDQ